MRQSRRWTEEDLASVRAHQNRAATQQLEPLADPRAQRMRAIAKRNTWPIGEEYRGQQHANGTIQLRLPWPPSVNRRIAHAAAVTEQERVFRQLVILICRQAKIRPLTGRLVVRIKLHPPRVCPTFDIDNRVKRTLDALQHGGCFPNDRTVDRLIVDRGERIGQGLCITTIWERRRCPSVTAL